MNRVVITGIGCCTSLGWEQGGIARAFAGGCPAFAPSEALPGSYNSLDRIDAEKLDALSALMRHMAGREDTFTEEQARGVAVLAIRVRSLSAKAKKH